MAALHIQQIPTGFLTNLPPKHKCIIKVVNYNLNLKLSSGKNNPVSILI